MTHEELAAFRLVYLATPYSKYHLGIDAAFEHAAALAAQLLRLRVKIFSPVSHGHPMAVYGRLNPTNHYLWLHLDEAMMRASDLLLVGKMHGWEESDGIAHEIEFFTKQCKPIVYLDPATLAATEEP